MAVVGVGSAEPGPDPGRVADHDDLVRELDLLRRRAAYGTAKARVSLADLAKRCGVPRSTLHTYLNGMRLPPPDVLDQVVGALGAGQDEQRGWAEALARLEDADRGVAPAPVEPGRRVPDALPAGPRVFVGRDAALDRLDRLGQPGRLDADGRDRLAVLVGGGGMGKSALALHWAGRRADRFPHGRLHLDLQGFGPHPPREPGDALARLLRGLGLAPSEVPASLQDRVDLYADTTAGRRLLVVLDNARDADQVRPLLSPSPTVATIVTSRDDLSELVIEHDALPVRLDPLDEEAVEQLVAAALEDRRSGDGSVEERPDLDGLRAALARCSGMPLALRIVSERWLRGLAPGSEPRSPAELLDEMGLGARQLGVRTTLGWTVDHLTPEVRQVFRRISAVPQAVVGSDLAAAAAGVTPREGRLALESLTAVHLADPVPGGFARHDLVAAFAHERYLVEETAAERAAVDARVAAHLSTRAADAGRVLDWLVALAAPPSGDAGEPFPDVAAARAWLERHLDSLLSLARGSRVSEEQRWLLAATLGRHRQYFDVTIDVSAHLREATASARRAGSDAVVSELENLRGIGHAIDGDHQRAWRHLTVALRRAQRGGSPAAVEVARANLAKLAGRVGRHDQALSVFSDLVAARGVREATQRLSLAETLFDLGDLDGVREQARWVLDHQDRAVTHDLAGTAYHFLAQVEARSGRPAAARELLARAPAADPGLAPWHAVDRLSTEHDIAVAEGRLDEAVALQRQALREELRTGDASGACRCLLALAGTELRRDDPEAAGLWLAEIDARARPVGLEHWTMVASLLAVRVAHRLGDLGTARLALAGTLADADRLASTPVRDLARRVGDELALVP